MSNLDLSTLLKAGALSLVAALAAPLSSASANAPVCHDLPSSLASDPLQAEGFRVVDTYKLYRVQDRPWAHIPSGTRLTVRAPAGLTGADLYRAALCRAGASSPLSVPGAKLRVVRVGDLYELHVTASGRDAALEIQRRAAAL